MVRVGIKEMRPQKFILVRQARFVPIGLILCSLFLAFTSSLWWLLSIPFVVIGALFTAPNLNFVNGFFSYVSIVLGSILTIFYFPVGIAVLLGIVFSFFGSAIEMLIFSQPVSPEDKGQYRSNVRSFKGSFDPTQQEEQQEEQHD